MTYQFLERNATILGGKPIVKGTRISVAVILEWLATGGTLDTINAAYPQVSVSAIREVLLYASRDLTGNEYVNLTRNR